MTRTVNGYVIAPQADLYGANLRGANLYRATLSKACLSRANLSKAGLSGANLAGADLSNANLAGAVLVGANLTDANLFNANLVGADLVGAVGIVSFGPVGNERRIGYAVASDSGVNIKLGCFWGSLENACIAVRDKYGQGSAYEKIIRAAAEVLLTNH